MEIFDDGPLRELLCCLVNDKSWLQATLPLCFGGLVICSSIHTAPAAFLASCYSSNLLVCQLLNRYSIHDNVPPSIPGVPITYELLESLFPIWSFSNSYSQSSLQPALDNDQFQQLFKASSIHDHAHLNSL